ncbi:DUF4177 domain-containing protein [Longimicrobium terrae]|uniref:DUF4177 domain-containing protein n=1 Tax=Longimicrobium terrae TaxID=1639882 RepID=A0A841GPG6_9BACT|nr:DUF4177 domain-containing protein [Longimicrobium terrae]MBB4634270.1 hypothetical protein [Longimicrobium terrae]MBB6068840.1 hypothetical protein [Longimicrobium terrae]NNC28022.1 DUF4177 domain-containing protein [Longimicrobium terrae]
MRQYKVEALAYYPKLTADKDHVIQTSKAEIQHLLDHYARRGWRLASTNATDSGSAVYVYLYFEGDGSAL